MEKSKSGMAYCLIIKNDASSYSWLITAVETTAEEATNALFKWFAAFGTVSTWISKSK